MDEAIHVPPFPPLAWRDNWVGEVALPAWAESFRDGGGPYWLEVVARDKTLPTPEQAAAFAHLVENEAAVTEAVARALLEYYPDAREGCIDAYDGDSACIAEVEAILPAVVTDVAGLRGIVGLSFVFVLPVARDGTAYVGFQLGCEWDGEHGAGVLTHRGRVVLTGQADAAFATWAAKKDAARAAPGTATDSGDV